MALDHFSVTRNTTKTVLNKNGVLETVPANVPAFEFNPDGTFKGCLIEPSGTNLVQRSQEFGNAYWTKNNVVINENSAVAPDGTTTANTITCNQDSIGSAVGFGRDGLSATSATLSLFVKKGNRRYIRLISTTTVEGTTFDLNLGEVESIDTVRHSGAKIIQYPNNWYRLIVNTNNDVSNTSFRVRFINDALVFGGNNGDFHFIWGAQLEAGSVATSYIPTTTSTATRNADLITKTGASGLIGQTEGTMYAEIDIQRQGILARVIELIGENIFNTDWVILTIEDSNVLRLNVRENGSGVLNIDTAPLDKGVYKICGTYKSGETSLFVNGVKIGTNTTSYTFADDLKIINVGQLQGGISRWLNNHIRSIALEKRALTEAEAIKRTTL